MASRIRTTGSFARGGSSTVALCLALSGALGARAAGDVTERRVLEEAPAGAHWFLKGGSFRGEHFSPLDEVNVETVADLGLAWSTTLDAPDGVAATPIVVDGTAYLSASMSIVYAVDAKTGRLRWRFDPEVRRHFAIDPYLSWTARANRGVAVWQGKVYVATAACELIAIDAATGQRRWSRITCDPAQGYTITDSPYVGGDKVFIGNAGSESGEKNRGYVSAYDADDGRLLWRFYTVPSSDADENDTAALEMAARTWSGDALASFGGGGSAWNEMTYDPESRLLFFGTAGALPYAHAVRSPEGGDNLFTSSVLAVHADDGAYAWHYQTVPEDSWEYNATMNIVLADIVIDGRERRTLLIAPKNGFFYVLDRMTGELLSAEKYATVNWATHINLETGRPELDADGMYWRRPATAVTMIWPNMWGAHSWQPMAYHPELRLAYVPVVDLPSAVTAYADGDFTDALIWVSEVDGAPHSPGKLVAWDPVAQRARWRVDHAFAGNGGVLATAGNLVFQGGGDGAFSAYRADTGKRLWSVATGSPINAAPVSYLIDGEQFVLVPIGSGGGMQSVYPELHANEEDRGPTRLLAFSLNGAATLPEDDPGEVALPRLPALEAPAEVIAAGRELYADSCAFCHGKNATARRAGSVPDLRYADLGIHERWDGIVIRGELEGLGMPRFELSTAQSQAIRAYVLSRAYLLRDGEGS